MPQLLDREQDLAEIAAFTTGPAGRTRLVVANRVQVPDGRWTALDGRDLYRHRLAVDAIYRAAASASSPGRSGSSGQRPTAWQPGATGHA